MGVAVCAAAAATVSTAERRAKWSRSARPATTPATYQEPLFLMDDGSPLPVMRESDPIFRAHGFLRDPYRPREVAQPFRVELASNLLLRLRAFLGVNARCETLAYLLLHGRLRALAVTFRPLSPKRWPKWASRGTLPPASKVGIATTP